MQNTETAGTKLLHPAPRMRRAVKGTVRQLFGELNQYYLRAYFYLLLDRIRGRRPLLVHQMGKVGSTTVVSSLVPYVKKQKRVIHQTHFLSADGIAFVEELEVVGHGTWQQLPHKTKRFLVKSRVLGRVLHNQLLLPAPHEVITLVREPIATNLSGFFHNADWWPPALIAQCQERREGWQDALRAYFLETYPHETPLRWFDLELAPLFEIDVYATPFSLEDGYKVYHTPQTKLLLLKLEALNSSAGAAFQEFMQIDSFQLSKTNRAEDKWYADLYREFTKGLVLPESYLDQMYESRYGRHFYSEAERTELRARWS